MRFCILHKSMGGLEPPPAPPGYATDSKRWNYTKVIYRCSYHMNYFKRNCSFITCTLWMCPKYSLYQQQKQLRLKVTVRLKTERSHPVSCLVVIYEKLCKCAFHNNTFFDEMKPLIYKMNNLLLTSILARF